MAKKKEKVINWRIVCVGLVCLTILEMYALYNGINGTLLKTVIAIIALSIGVTIKSPFTLK